MSDRSSAMNVETCSDCQMSHPKSELFEVWVPERLEVRYDRNPFYLCQKCWNHVMGLALMQAIR